MVCVKYGDDCQGELNIVNSTAIIIRNLCYFPAVCISNY